jgi:hypothetical protein
MMIEHLRMQSVSVRQHLGSNDRFRFVLPQSIGQQVDLMANSQMAMTAKAPAAAMFFHAAEDCPVMAYVTGCEVVCFIWHRCLDDPEYISKVGSVQMRRLGSTAPS